MLLPRRSIPAAQTYDRWELIIAASPPGDRRTGALFPGRRVREGAHQARCPGRTSRTAALELAAGDWVILLEPGDVLPPLRAVSSRQRDRWPCRGKDRLRGRRPARRRGSAHRLRLQARLEPRFLLFAEPGLAPGGLREGPAEARSVGFARTIRRRPATTWCSGAWSACAPRRSAVFRAFFVTARSPAGAMRFRE